MSGAGEVAMGFLSIHGNELHGLMGGAASLLASQWRIEKAVDGSGKVLRHLCRSIRSYLRTSRQYGFQQMRRNDEFVAIVIE